LIYIEAEDRSNDKSSYDLFQEAIIYQYSVKSV